MKREPKPIHIWNPNYGAECQRKLKITDWRIFANQMEVEEFKPNICKDCLSRMSGTRTEGP